MALKNMNSPKEKLKIIVTGGAGFIGSALVRLIIKETKHKVLNVDNLTYAGNLESLKDIESSKRYSFLKINICDSYKIRKLFREFQPNIIINLAAESHVDRSIDNSSEFIETNIIGTHNLLETSREYLSQNIVENFRFHHVSTDEVYGDLGHSSESFTELSRYEPSSPYAASKASADHLVRAWHRTYNLPIVITNCSNNFGPFQFPEKLIPNVILKSLQNSKIPVYGDGKQVRDWLYVEDHARAILQVALYGKDGESYNIGGNNEKTNIEVIKSICDILDKIKPNDGSYFDLVEYVEDRAGHDIRYAIDSSKITHDLGWSASETFNSGLEKTIKWYLDNNIWLEKVQTEKYNGERLGLIKS